MSRNRRSRRRSTCGEPVGIFLDRRCVVGCEPAQLGQIGVRSIQQLSPLGRGRIDLLQRGERPVGQAECAQRIPFISLQGVHDALRLLHQSTGLTQPAGLDLKHLILAGLDPGAVNLIDHMPQVIGPAAHFVPPR